ncbi:RICIN domain-containing protein [uncultured Desulfobacter sp.]|uniref:RICIN domain-containing protein n=1 Tax=uncultured Desulfobacter sp. TaxID=240139 RepID=UPI003749B390
MTSGRYYKIVNTNSGKVLDIAGARKDNGGMSMQWRNTNSPSNLWQFIPGACPLRYGKRLLSYKSMSLDSVIIP